MSRSVVEKYEQILAQDPSSSVFVELARAFIERGDHQKAISVCQQGLTHHPRSVAGRVLWGKALIHLGKASEAMGQFDLAVGIDKENPHAYNLISEVLLRKGLYRSALPILRKASALQPNDGRIKQWLEQTKAALAGGPAPVLSEEQVKEPTTSEMPLPEGEATALIQQPGVAAKKPVPPPNKVEAALAQLPQAQPAHSNGAASKVKKVDDSAMPTVVTSAYTPDNPAATLADSQPLVMGEVEQPTEAQTTEAHTIGRTSATQEIPNPVAAKKPLAPTVEVPNPQEADPFAGVPKRTESSDTIRGLTSTFDALTQGSPDPSDPFASFAPPTSPGNVPVVKAPAAGAAPAEPTIIPAQDLIPAKVEAPKTKEPAPAPKAKPAPFEGGLGLLDDIEAPSSEDEMPTMAQAVPADLKVAPQPAASSARRSLLEDIPDALEPQSSLEVPKVEVNKESSEAIAKEYERELRAKLAAAQQKKTFLQAHGLKLAAGLGLLVIVAGLGGSFIYTRWKNAGKDLATAVAEGRSAANADTKEKYGEALKALAQAAQMDSSSPEVWGFKAWAHAMLYAEHTRAPADKAAAAEALGHPGVREQFPEIAQVVEWQLSEGNSQARAALLSSNLEKAEVQTEAGRLLLADGKMDEAFKKLERSVQLLPTHVRALVALGEYYLQFEDYESAEKVLTGPAQQLSPAHPQRVLALAQARLELGRDQGDSLTEVEKLPATSELPVAQRARRELVHGRLLSAAGKHERAIEVLTAGSNEYKDKGFEFAFALGNAYRMAGQMEKAQKSLEAALKLKPGADDAREALGRVLIARSREKELLANKLLAPGTSRKVALVRGIAWARLGDNKNARAEFERTKVNEKVPAEAAIYLAVAQAQEEGGEKAVALLEKLSTTSKKNKGTVLVALARIYMQRGALDKAKAALTEAAKDPLDYEANAALGELLLSLNLPEMAVDPLTKAVERNASHGPSRKLLAASLITMGRVADALKNAEAWVADNPASEDAQKALAAALFYSGRAKDADAPSQKATRNSEDIDAWRIRARVQFALADPRGGLKSLETANKLNPKDAETFCEIGHAFVRQGTNETALAAYQAAVREDPKAVCGKIGPYHARPFGGRPAVKELNELLKTPMSAADKALLLSALARVQLNSGSLKDARDAADDAVQTMPQLSITQYALGLVALKSKDEAKALEALGRAAEYDGSFSPARLAWADLLAKGDAESVKRAVGEYEAFLALSQNEGDVARVRKMLPQLKSR